MQNDLTSVEWREFKISDVFDVYTGALIHQNDIKIGKIPRITATDVNNGVALFTDDIKHKNFRILENFISISFLGSVFYQSKKVSLDMKIHGIKIKNKELNYYSALFLIPLIKKFTFKYSYGYQLSTSVLKNQKIQLPIDSRDNPNWQFMENYMKNIEQKYINNIVNYYNKKLANDYGGGVATSSYSNHSTRDRSIFIEDGLMKIAQENLKLENIKWKEFSFDFVFKEIKRGKRLIKDNQFQGKTPYVSSSALNNGVDNFINNSENIRKFSNCISLANSGSVGSAFFHSYEFVASDHVTQLIQPKFSKYVYLFLLPIIARLSEKYSFNREINDKRINREKLLLPIDSKGNPDYALIESYMKNIEYRKIQNIIKYYKNKY